MKTHTLVLVCMCTWSTHLYMRYVDDSIGRRVMLVLVLTLSALFFIQYFGATGYKYCCGRVAYSTIFLRSCDAPGSPLYKQRPNRRRARKWKLLMTAMPINKSK